MQSLKLLPCFIVGLLLLDQAIAATVHGTIYDLSLKKINNARVEINTAPKQFLIAQNGSYLFIVPNGAYTIKAQLMQKSTVISYVEENITIRQDGSYVLDLILFPDIEEGVEEIDIDVNENLVESRNNFISVLGILLMILMIVVFYFIRKNKQIKKETSQKEEQGNNVQQIIKIIREEGGRTTQKEIRKQIPLSEAKISLMIAELEHKGLIEKIKKGRGNIIILKR